jgi:arginine utilization protein RocB
MDIQSRIYNTLINLCRIRSKSGTSEEADAAEQIFSLISHTPYFIEHKEHLRLHPIPGDPFGRSYITAFYKGSNPKKAVILLSHFDTVEADAPEHLRLNAIDPARYMDMLKNETLPEDAAEDLNDGRWLFGRGAMDMKCGLAIHIELINYIYENNIDIGGSLLLLTVPDEENSSAGMLAAAEYLSSLAGDGFEFAGAINSEPFFPEDSGDDSRYIYSGTVGKLLPLVVFAGLEYHGGEAFGGISSSLLSSMTTSLIECSAALCDSLGGYTVPPPVCLKQADIKELYSVSPPVFSYAYYNYMTLSSSPEEVIGNIKKVCKTAFDAAFKRVRDEAAVFSSISGRKVCPPPMKASILSYSELCSLLKEQGTEIEDIREKYRGCAMDQREITASIIRDMLEHLPHLRPAAIVSLSPPYYPHRAGSERINRLCRRVIRTSENEYDEGLIQKPFFPGLCDLSYLGAPDTGQYDVLKTNMPAYGLSYSFPSKALSSIDIDGVNIGVWGRGIHKYTERLNIPYSMEVTPGLVLDGIRELLREGEA